MTRLGEYSPVGKSLNLGRSMKIIQVAQILLCFSMEKVLFNFYKKRAGYTLGDFFLKTYLVALISTGLKTRSSLNESGHPDLHRPKKLVRVKTRLNALESASLRRTESGTFGHKQKFKKMMRPGH
jgi:hypothetical protein